MRTLHVKMQGFLTDLRGSVSIFFGISCIVLFGMIGLALDMSRFYNYSSHLQAALDAAALVGAKSLPDSSMTDGEISDLVNANFAAVMTKSGVKANTLSVPQVKIDRGANSVEIIGTANLPAMLLPIVSNNGKVDIVRSSKVVFDMTKVELAMVLDITGSMNNNNKLADMKQAAKDVIDELYDGSLSEDGVRIALAPYSASVNAGALASTVTNVPVTTTCSWVWFQWKCVDSSGIDQDTCVIERVGSNAATDAAPVGSDKLPNVPTLPYGNYNCPAATVLPLQGKSQRETVKSTIDSYLASGATAGHIGAAWGWYLLAPTWSSVLGGSAPADYNEDNLQKSVIIMTDGEFNTSYLTGGSTDAVTQSNQSYAQFEALCDGIKGKGITVYTVGFDLTSPRALSELQSCASGGDNFFDAKTGADLKKAFKDIAKKLNKLRVAS